MLMTYTDFWPKQVIVEERYSETKHGMVPNNRAAAAVPLLLPNASRSIFP
jgi:hypothetical protein